MIELIMMLLAALKRDIAVHNYHYQKEITALP